mmetsp:Transcript_120125/g.224563  ORF Transcript_120125/g.224563 Transcript_120125/m.224563 type:complete len:206 (+) Transcript_120125:648-1265(+)
MRLICGNSDIVQEINGKNANISRVVLCHAQDQVFFRTSIIFFLEPVHMGNHTSANLHFVRAHKAREHVTQAKGLELSWLNATEFHEFRNVVEVATDLSHGSEARQRLEVAEWNGNLRLVVGIGVVSWKPSMQLLRQLLVGVRLHGEGLSHRQHLEQEWQVSALEVLTQPELGILVNDVFQVPFLRWLFIGTAAVAAVFARCERFG